MRPTLTRFCLAAGSACGRGLLTAAIWSLWLLLVVTLGLETYVATSKELQLPPFVLRAIEAHLAESGVSVKFGRAVFDPSGRILIENARFRLASFEEPVVTAEAIYVRLDPWALFERRVEPREIRATGANLYVPAMLSSSGKSEKVVDALDAQFSIASRGDEFQVDYLNCRLGRIFVSAHGTVNAGTVSSAAPHAETALPLAAFLSRNYTTLSREVAKAEDRMAGLEQATLTATLVPSDTRGAIVHAELSAAALRMAQPLAVEATTLRVSSRFPLLGGTPIMTTFSATAERLSVGGRGSADGVRARVRGTLRMDTLSFDPKEVDVAAGSVAADGVVLTAPVLRVTPLPTGALDAEIGAEVFGVPVHASGRTSLADRTATVAFEGRVTPATLDALADRLNLPLNQFTELTEPVSLSGQVGFTSGWKFSYARGHVDGRNFEAYHVHFDEARGDVSWDGRLLAATHAVAVAGDYLAMGSYTQDFNTLAYRYLLEGRIRPLYITPWFSGTWWTGIFEPYGFPESPVEANIDVQGVYIPHGRVFSVFGYATAKRPLLLNVPFDAFRTRIYVDQDVCKIYEFEASQGAGKLRGSARLDTEPAQGVWTGLDLEATSSIDPSPLAVILPADGARALAAFTFERPPLISTRAHIDGPAAEGVHHLKLHADVRSDSALRVHGVSFERAAFGFDVLDDSVDVGDVDAGFAGGTLTGKGRLSGSGADRRLTFKAALNGASFGAAAAAAAGYVKVGAPGKSTALGAFAKEKAGVRLDLNLSGEGRPGDLPTFAGDGNFQIQGSELGELSLLGGLSKLFKVTALRFTQASSQFKLVNGSLVFPELQVIGANSAIQAKGTYLIDQGQLDFTAKIYPFKESKSLMQIFNALSTPFSAFFEVRLAGSLDKPTWSFAMSPFNILKPGEAKPAVPSPIASPGP